MIREDTAANFQLSDPILALGEIGVETDTGKSKIGNGVTSWNLLQYSNITTAARHNLLQARLDQILGRGAGQSGYGQGIANYGPSLTSYQVSNLSDSNLNSISAVDVNSLYADMLRARVHQIGTAPTEIAQIVTELNTIAEKTSSFVGNDGIFTPDPEGSKKGIVNYENLMNNIELDKFRVHPSQVTLESAVSSTRSSPWNGIIFHEFTVSFINADHRRHFFNSGSEIRITSVITGAASLKGQDWAAFMSNVGTVRMNYNSTTNANNSGGSSIGNYGLTGLYQIIYQKSSQGTVSAIYAGNIYKISARSVGADSIQFKVEYNDVSTGSFVDVNVTGILENSVQLYRADSVYVSVPKPTTVTGIGLSTFTTPQPIYSLSASSPGVSEGGAVTINLTTVNVPNGTLVPYNIQGVTSADIGGALLNGNFQVVNNSAKIVINLVNDNILANSDSEVLTVRLANGSSNVSVNIVDTTPNPVYSLTASSPTVYEGFPVTFNLAVQNLPAGTQIPYTISGITSADINGQSLVGNFITNANGQASLTLQTTIDNFEEIETITVSLNNTSVSRSVQLLDALYTLLSSKSSPVEGDTVNITLVTNKIPNGALVPYTISGVSSTDINIPLTGSFTVTNNQAQVSITFIPDAVVDPNEQFTLSLNNGKSSITLSVTDSPLPVSANRTCIAVIDESSQLTLNNSWSKFRSTWPNRPFYLLQPGRTRPELREPVAFVNDPLTDYSQVKRDNGTVSQASDWYTLCNIDQLPNGSKLALFIDTSGSMTLATVQASYNLFKQKIAIRNMTIIEVFNGNEDWILPFDTILD